MAKLNGVLGVYVDTDLNSDGLSNEMDLDLLALTLVAGDSPPQYDLNGDGIVSRHDLEKWLHDAAAENGFLNPYFEGDANLDGIVDTLDLNAMALNWRRNVATWSGGDFTTDGSVDAADLNVMALHWQDSIDSASTVVPEPGCLALLGTIIALVAIRRSSNSMLGTRPP